LRALDHLRRKVREALADGFAGLWLVAEMTWALAADIRGDVLEEWESLLEQTREADALIVACLYHYTRFAPDLLRHLIRSHSKVIADDYVSLSLSVLFQNLARTDLRGFMQAAREHRIPRGGFYFRQGERAIEVYLLVSGYVKLIRTDPDGRNAILRIVKPSEPFGDRAVLGGTTRLASAQALEDSRAFAWEATTFFQGMMTHPVVSLNAARLLEERVEEQRDQLHDLATSSVKRRLARLLLRFAQSLGRKTPRGVAIRVVLSRQDFAEMIGTTYYTVSRALAEWRRLDIVDVQRQRILILDQKRLAAIAGTGTSEEVSRTRGRRPGPSA